MGHVCRIHEGDQHCAVVVPYPYNGSIVDGLTIIWGIQSAGGSARNRRARTGREAVEMVGQCPWAPCQLARPRPRWTT